MLDTILTGGTLVLDDRTVDGWLGIDEGTIAAVGTGAPPPASATIDCSGKHVLPGRVEPHCHVRAGLLADDIERITREAVAGGVTTVMPYMRAKEPYSGLIPAWDEAVRTRAHCDVAYHLQLQTPGHLEEIADLHERFGIVSFKAHIDYRHPVGPLDIAPVDDGDVYLALQAVREFGGIVAVHCENSEITKHLVPRMQASGRADLAAWADAVPPVAEASDANAVVFLAKVVDARILLVHVSSPETLAAARRHDHAQTYTEVLAHQLAVPLEDAQSRFAAAAKFNPPLRDRAALESLWESVIDGGIDIVGTDHSAFSSLEGALPDPSVSVWEHHRHVAAGIGVALPLFLSLGIERGIGLARLVQMMSSAPARLMGLGHRKGSLAVGLDADVTVIDLGRSRVVQAGTAWSPNVTIADGLELRGWPELTLLRGNVVFKDGAVGSVGGGEVVRGRTHA
jgi:dihydropyrimidinase